MAADDECDCWLCKPELADRGCECRYCRGIEPDAGGCAQEMQPNFESPEPATFTADTDQLESYALGWTHGWDDHEASERIDGHTKPVMGRRGLVNGFFLASIIWALVGLFVLACPAQGPAPVQAGSGAFNYGYVTDSARTFLEQGWDTSNAYQVERGYCIEPSDVTVDTTDDHANVAWKIHHVTIATRTSIATPYAIGFECSPTAIASMHIHTPTTCTRDPRDMYGFKVGTCAFGGDDGYLCSVDETDRTNARRDWFMVVQCGRGQFVWYWPGKRG